MKFSYEFSNLYGTVYRNGNLIFTADGNTVISPVGNKITMFDLKHHTSQTLPIEARYNYTCLALSPNGTSLVAATEIGEIHLISMISKTILHRMNFHKKVLSIKFSPDSKHIAFTKENDVVVYKSPGPYSRDYSPFVFERCLRGSYDFTTTVTWSDCSKLVAVGGKDMIARIYAIRRMKNVGYCTLSGLNDSVVGVFFEANSLDIYTVSAGSQLSIWDSSLTPEQLEYEDTKNTQTKSKWIEVESDNTESEDDESSEHKEKQTQEDTEETQGDETITWLKYKRQSRHYLSSHVEDNTRLRLEAVDYHQKTKILVSAFSNGVFLLLSLPDVSLIHSLAISEQAIESVCFNKSGDWIAFGCPDLGQLLVWEWQSETYVLKQQGHASSMNCLSYSPDGSLVATGGEDSKVKLWNTSTGFCFVTFSEHEATVTGVCFMPNGKVVLSSSVDGTVRAFDMTRYRNFKTFTTPRPVQLSCLSVDSSGDLIAAGGQDVFEIYLWSLTTGRLVDVLTGHEGPVASLSFSNNPTSSQLASVSWDKTVKIWDSLESNNSRDTIQLTSEAKCVCWRPDGKALSVATLSGHIHTFDTQTSDEISSISGRKDMRKGRGQNDRITAEKKTESSAFSSLCYSADGSSILAGGNSKYICIYNVAEQLLIKKFEITQNRSFDCMDEIINRRKMTDFGNLALIEDRDDPGSRIKLPGTKAKDMSSRTLDMEVNVLELGFSPTGRNFSAVTTEGLLVYSLDKFLSFDPFLLDTKITPAGIKTSLKNEDHMKALMDAFKLSEKNYLIESFERTPAKDIPLIVKQWPLKFLQRLMNHVAGELESSRHIEFYLKWAKSIMIQHSLYIKSNSQELMPVLNLFVKNITRRSEDLAKVCENNKFSLNYLLTVGVKADEAASKAGENCDNIDMKEVEESDSDSEVDMTELQAKWDNEDDNDDQIDDESSSNDSQSDQESMDEN